MHKSQKYLMAHMVKALGEVSSVHQMDAIRAQRRTIERKIQSSLETRSRKMFARIWSHYDRENRGFMTRDQCRTVIGDSLTAQIALTPKLLAIGITLLNATMVEELQVLLLCAVACACFACLLACLLAAW